MDLSTRNTEGLLALQLGDYETAEKIFEECVNEDKQSPQLHYNLALTHYRQGRRAEARVRFNTVVNLCASFSDAWAMIGVIANEERKYLEASYAWEEAYKHETDAIKGREYLSLRGRNELIQGNIKKGFDLLEAAIEPQPKQWNRDISIAGKKLLVIGNEGYGDQIFNARWLPWLEDTGAKIYLAVRDPVRYLLDGTIEVKEIDALRKECDYEIKLSDLPTIFRPTIGTIPVNPYIETLATQVGQAKNIGLTWSGNPLNPNNANRSIPLSLFSPLLELDGVNYTMLQRDVLASDAEAFAKASIEEVEYEDFLEVARTIWTLDLVITCDTAAANLAGAMGARAWVLVPYAADWRWGADGDSTIWYPSVKVFRQGEDRRWEPVIERVKQELLELNNGQ